MAYASWINFWNIFAWLLFTTFQNSQQNNFWLKYNYWNTANSTTHYLWKRLIVPTPYIWKLLTSVAHLHMKTAFNVQIASGDGLQRPLLTSEDSLQSCLFTHRNSLNMFHNYQPQLILHLHFCYNYTTMRSHRWHYTIPDIPTRLYSRPRAWRVPSPPPHGPRIHRRGSPLTRISCCALFVLVHEVE